MADMPYHIDSHSDFEESIAIVSTLSGIVLQMFNPETKHIKHVWIPKNSLVVMTGSARYLWEHGITSRCHDKIDEFTKIKRSRRVSLAFRTFRGSKCKCSWKTTCVDQGSSIYKKLPSKLADAVPMLRR
jgi:hypothetical protein